MKKKLFLLTIITILFMPVFVKADIVKDIDLSYGKGKAGCVSAGTCELMCGYTNTIGEDKYSVYIYYNYSQKKFYVGWPYYKSQQLNLSYKELDEKEVHMDDSIKSSLLSSGTCPNNGYVENPRSLVTFKPEVCFDNDGTYCSNISFKQFEGTSKLEKNNKGIPPKEEKDNGNKGEQKPSELKNCESLLGNPQDPNEPAFYLATAYRVIKYVALILLIVLSILDFLGAVSSQNDDAMKKTISKVIKRVILCVILFILQPLLEFVLSYMHNQEMSTCIGRIIFKL